MEECNEFERQLENEGNPLYTSWNVRPLERYYSQFHPVYRVSEFSGHFGRPLETKKP